MGFEGLEGFIEEEFTIKMAQPGIAQRKAVLDGCSKATLEPIKEGEVQLQMIKMESRGAGEDDGAGEDNCDAGGTCYRGVSSGAVISSTSSAHASDAPPASPAAASPLKKRRTFGGRLMDRMVHRARRVRNLEAFLTGYGNPIAELIPAPFFGKQGSEYGLARAVTLYLRFQVQAACLFAVIFGLSLPHVVDNYIRNDLRNECRAELGLGGNASRCGYDRFSVRSTIDPIPDGTERRLDWLQYGPLHWSPGACEEYASGTNYTLPVPGLEADIFVDVTGSPTCGGRRASVAYWFDFLIILVELASLLFLRYQARQAADDDDRQRWTTGDYSVLLRGLDDGLDDDQPEASRRQAFQLREALMEDLAALGFESGKIVQVEVGRRCREEVKCLKRLDVLHMRVHEVCARVVHRLEVENAELAAKERDAWLARPAEVLKHFTPREIARSYMLTHQMERIVAEFQVRIATVSPRTNC
jgi:hypothetical protein